MMYRFIIFLASFCIALVCFVFLDYYDDDMILSLLYNCILHIIFYTICNAEPLCVYNSFFRLNHRQWSFSRHKRFTALFCFLCITTVTGTATSAVPHFCSTWEVLPVLTPLHILISVASPQWQSINPFLLRLPLWHYIHICSTSDAFFRWFFQLGNFFPTMLITRTASQRMCFKLSLSHFCRLFNLFLSYSVSSRIKRYSWCSTIDE